MLAAKIQLFIFAASVKRALDGCLVLVAGYLLILKYCTDQYPATSNQQLFFN
jgi:hypothetical protein